MRGGYYHYHLCRVRSREIGVVAPTAGRSKAIKKSRSCLWLLGARSASIHHPSRPGGVFAASILYVGASALFRRDLFLATGAAVALSPACAL